jgi:hypothetical protein
MEGADGMSQTPAGKSLEELAAQLTLAWVQANTMVMGGKSDLTGFEPACGPGGQMQMGPTAEDIGAAFENIFAAVVRAKRKTDER